MTIFSRLLPLTALLLLLTVGPAHAQRAQASETSGPTSAVTSDQSGASATNSDAIFFESDEVRIRMNDIASPLAQALRSGKLGPSVVPGAQPVLVSPMMKDLLAASSPEDVTAARGQFTDVLTATSLPPKEAKAFARAVAGLLAEGTVSPLQVQDALNTYNAAIDAAPAQFLVQPPHELMVVRAVLMALLEGTV